MAYAFEPQEQPRTVRLQRVLEPYAAGIPDQFLYFPSRAQVSGPLRLLVEAVKELAGRV